MVTDIKELWGRDREKEKAHMEPLQYPCDNQRQPIRVNPQPRSPLRLDSISSAHHTGKGS